MTNHKVLLTLTKDQHTALKARAAHTGITLSAMLRIIVQSHLDADQRSKTASTKDDKSHIRAAYDAHIAQLGRDLVLDSDRSLVWKSKLAQIQKAWGKDGAFELPFPAEQWTALLPTSAPITPRNPVQETEESIFADLKKRLSQPTHDDLDDIDFEE